MLRSLVLALAFVVSCAPRSAVTTTTPVAARASAPESTSRVHVQPLRVDPDVTLLGLVRDDGGWWLTYDEHESTSEVERVRTRIDANGMWARQSTRALRGVMATPVVDAKGRWHSLESGEATWMLHRDDGVPDLGIGNGLEQAVSATIAIDPDADAPRGAIVWWLRDSLLRHDDLGNGQLVWRELRRQGQPHVTFFDRAGVRHAQLWDLVDEMEREAGQLAVANAGEGFVATWRDPASVVHAVWLDANGVVARRGATPALPDIGDPRHLVAAQDGSVRLFAIASHGADATIAAVGFEARGRVRAPLRVREPHADQSRAAAIHCGGRPWLLFVRDASTTQIDIRAIAVEGDRLTPAITLRTITVPGRAADTALFPFELDLRVGCRGDEGAFVGLVREDDRMERMSVVFGTWAAGSGAR